MRCPPPSRTPDLSDVVSSGLLARSAGTSPTTTPTVSAIAADTASTRPSMGADVHSTAGRRTVRSSCAVIHATTSPAAPPAVARIMLSVRRSRTSRNRPAPRASRTATSRRRRTARARSRFTTFEHAMNSTITATPTSQREIATSAVSFPRPSNKTGATKSVAAASTLSAPAYAWRNAAAASAPACSAVTPGLRRTMTRSHCAFQARVQFWVTVAETSDIGSHTSTRPSCGPVNPRGAIPTIVYVSSPRMIVRPTAERSPPNARRQRPSPRTATWSAPEVRSSSLVKKRPAAG